MTDKEIEEIIKPIFKKMFYDNFSACDFGIECYKIGQSDAQKWHFVKDGDYPNVGNQVFVYGKNQNGYKWTGCLNYQEREDDCDERTGFYDEEETCFDEEVVAWQYLPEPPQKEKVDQLGRY